MRLRDEQGMMAIGVALMLIVVLALFGGVLWQSSMAEMQRVARTERDLKALFLAKSGAEAVMAAWIEAPHNGKPQGAMDRIYFDSESGQFQCNEPEDLLGYVDVVVTKIDDPDSERNQLTEIVATAVVEGISRQVKVITYPHLLGHDESLKWYYEQTGVIRSTDAAADELVIVRSQRPIHFQKNAELPSVTGFTSPMILFERALDLSFDQQTEYRIWPELGSYTEKILPIRAETIFFDDVVLLDLPIKGGPFSMNFTVTLQLPTGECGILGSEIPGAEPATRYGRVYFDGNTVATQYFRWRRTWFIVYLYRIELNGSPVPLKTPENHNLAGRAFYFRDGTDLSNIGPNDLIPMGNEGDRRNELREIKPFIWE